MKESFGHRMEGSFLKGIAANEREGLIEGKRQSQRKREKKDYQSSRPSQYKTAELEKEWGKRTGNRLTVRAMSRRRTATGEGRVMDEGSVGKKELRQLIDRTGEQEMKSM